MGLPPLSPSSHLTAPLPSCLATDTPSYAPILVGPRLPTSAAATMGTAQQQTQHILSHSLHRPLIIFPLLPPPPVGSKEVNTWWIDPPTNPNSSSHSSATLRQANNPVVLCYTVPVGTLHPFPDGRTHIPQKNAGRRRPSGEEGESIFPQTLPQQAKGAYYSHLSIPPFSPSAESDMCLSACTTGKGSPPPFVACLVTTADRRIHGREAEKGTRGKRIFLFRKTPERPYLPITDCCGRNSPSGKSNNFGTAMTFLISLQIE